MADRVHPRDDSPPQSTEFKPRLAAAPLQEEHDQARDYPQSPTKPDAPRSEKPVSPPPGTYVIQIPKDQVYRVPPPVNAKRYERLSRRKPSRSPCCCCLCWLLALLTALFFLIGVASAVFYFVFRPESPDYSVERLSISGFNLTSSRWVSPEFDVTVRANNPNDKIGIYYKKGSSVDVYYDSVKLATGSLPNFYQGTNNVTVFVTPLKGSAVELTSRDRTAMIGEASKGRVPFKLALRAPVKIKVGPVETWEITVKVDCDITVDNLTAAAEIGSKKCDYGVDLW
ncbi:LATE EMBRYOGENESIS ABUNDANT (LEA) HYDROXYPROLINE-RICH GLYCOPROTEIN FAMILY [Salix koriyanagi]|uniref:LATE EMBRYOGENESIS ABUNDANT (LEA) HYDROXYPROLINE-RICH GLYCOPROTEIN FAMILY n=1 Tax=Salix koriyanagi TaxID=2511006 RepID=A0A9Q0V0J2_9ROSI|nr:LATE EMBRYOGENESIS ABUNDANT (LEA) HYDROXYPROLINE-RICH GLYCOPROTEIN FAMILY [Salix koriyanagi]